MGDMHAEIRHLHIIIITVVIVIIIITISYENRWDVNEKE